MERSGTLRAPQKNRESGEEAFDVERSVEDAQNVYPTTLVHQISNPIMTVKKYPDVLVGSFLIAVSALRESRQRLRFFPDPLDGSEGSRWVIPSDVVVDLPEPSFCFKSPPYLAHEEILVCISS